MRQGCKMPLLAVLAFLLAAVPLFAQNPGLEHMLRLNRRFASQLLAEQDYHRAADEYQKLAWHYSLADSTLATADTLRYLAGLCQRRLGDFSRSNLLLAAIRDRESSLGVEAGLLQAANHFNLKAHARSLDLLAEIDSTSLRQTQRLDHLRMANHLATGQLDLARELSFGLGGADSLKFAELISRVASAPAKKPALAALMSTLVPGSGKLYTGQILDGVTTFIICVFSGWRAWEGFSEAGLKSFDGWLFGAVTAYFYLGNIYGSAVSARNFNERTQNDLRKELERIINAEN